LDKIFNQTDSSPSLPDDLLRKISNSSLNFNNKEKSAEQVKSSDKTLNTVTKQSSSNLPTSGNKAILTTLTYSNLKKNPSETQNNIVNNNYKLVNPYLKTSFGNFSNVSDSDTKNTTPDKAAESGSFFNMSIGFDRKSQATFNSNITEKNKDGASKGNAFPAQTNANQDYTKSRVVITKENLLTEKNNLNNESNFHKR